jgi:uncharacterized membrane protein YdjX (TVP38/TMEM64 family)
MTLAVRARVIAGVVVATLLAGIVVVFLLQSVLGEGGLLATSQAIEEFIVSLGMWGVVGSIGLMIAHSFLPFPAELIAICNGMLFGLFWGTVITWVGAMLGAYLAFGLARWLGRPVVEIFVPQRRYADLDAWSRRAGGGALLFSRLIPVISFNLINYAAGLTRLSWWTFTWATGLGILPICILSVALGAGLLQKESGTWLWLSLAGFGGLSLWVVGHAVWTRRRRAAEATLPPAQPRGEEEG